MDLGRVYEQQGRYEDALAEFVASRDIAGDGSETLTALGHIYAVSGRRTESLRLLDELQELARRQYVSAYNLALVNAGLGELDQAFAWLEQAFEQHAEWVIYLGVDPRLDGLRSLPRFANLLRHVGLAP